MANASNPSDLPGVMGRDGVVRGIRFVALGIVLILCGVFAFVTPLVSTLAVTVIVGIAAGIAGVTQLIHAFREKAWAGFLVNVLLGVLYLAAGLLFLVRPLTAAFAITTLLAILLLVSGLGEIVMGIRIRPERGWVWLVVSGGIALAGAAWMWFRIPIAGLFVPGMAFGVALMFEGWAFVSVGLNRGK